MLHAFLPRDMPEELAVLTTLAMDLRWTWSHAGDALWRMVSPDIWERTQNPWLILQDIAQQRLEQLAGDAQFRVELQRLVAEREHYLHDLNWYDRQYSGTGIRGIAYSSNQWC